MLGDRGFFAVIACSHCTTLSTDLDAKTHSKEVELLYEYMLTLQMKLMLLAEHEVGVDLLVLMMSGRAL